MYSSAEGRPSRVGGGLNEVGGLGGDWVEELKTRVDPFWGGGGGGLEWMIGTELLPKTKDQVLRQRGP